MNDRGLSRLQRSILCELWRVYQQPHAIDRMPLTNGKTSLDEWGGQWSGRHTSVKRRGRSLTGHGQSASQRAADSRALRRLERRGLIVRRQRFAWREAGGPYTNYVQLTEDGQAVAQRLTSAMPNTHRICTNGVDRPYADVDSCGGLMTRPLPLWRLDRLPAIEHFLRTHPYTPVYTDPDGMDGLTVPEVITYLDWLRHKKRIGQDQWRLWRAKIEGAVRDWELSL